MKENKKVTELRKKIQINNFLPKFTFLKYFKDSSIKNFYEGPVRPPESWVKINYKAYPRFEQIQLPKFYLNDPILKLILKRKSNRDFKNYKISKEEIFYILNSASIRDRKVSNNLKDLEHSYFRAYPSAGARYPLEIYPLILNSKDFKKGLYHYNVILHSLEFMWTVNKKELKNIIDGQNFVSKASVLFILTGIIKRGLDKYGERYFRYVLLEAGHLAQNLLLLATNKNLKTCPIGGFKEDALMKLLDITEDELELPLYIIAVGK